MKIVSLIRDGKGGLHLVASRSPDLLRRELSAKTGTAELLWCAVPPQGQGAADVIDRALKHLGTQQAALAGIQADHITRVLIDLCLLEPRRLARRRWLRLALRNVARKCRLLIGLEPVGQARPGRP